MKIFTFISSLVALAVWSCRAQSWEDLSASAFTNAEIVWQTGTNTFPKSLWVYRRVLPRVFPEMVLSNAIVLASLQQRGFPVPSTNDFIITPKMPPNWPAPIPVLFGVYPNDAAINFSTQKFTPLASNSVPDDALLTSLVKEYAGRFGLKAEDLARGRLYIHWGDDNNTTLGRGIVFPRQLDGIRFFDNLSQGNVTEGLSMEFGSAGKIQAFNFRWSDVRRYSNCPTLTQDEIARCIKSHRKVIVPQGKDSDFDWLKSLKDAKKLIVGKIVVYYNDGNIMESSTEIPYARFVIPFVELEAVAESDNGPSHVKILCPIVSKNDEW